MMSHHTQSLSRRSALAMLTAACAAVMLILAVPSPAQAANLDQAKQAGLLGERADGLLGAVTSPLPADVATLMKSVNSQRMAKYGEIAKQNGTKVQAVQSIVGQKLIDRAAPGTYVNPGSGWVRK